MAYDRYLYVFNNPLRYTDPSGHGACDGPIKAPECDEIDPDGDGKVPYPKPTPVNRDQLTIAGQSAYDTYLLLWNYSDGWWWSDPNLGGDGVFSIDDFATLVLYFELDNQYDNPEYVLAWTEALARAQRGWANAMRDPNNPQAVLWAATDPTTDEGLLNWIYAYSGRQTRTKVSDFQPPNQFPAEAIPVAQSALMAIINPFVEFMGAIHPEWASGWAADRPYAVSSNSKGSVDKLWYIYAYVDAGCPHYGTLVGICGDPWEYSFSFILTGDQANACWTNNCEVDK